MSVCGWVLTPCLHACGWQRCFCAAQASSRKPKLAEASRPHPGRTGRRRLSTARRQPGQAGRPHPGWTGCRRLSTARRQPGQAGRPKPGWAGHHRLSTARRQPGHSRQAQARLSRPPQAPNGQVVTRAQWVGQPVLAFPIAMSLRGLRKPLFHDHLRGTTMCGLCVPIGASVMLTCCVAALQEGLGGG
jgi:hypothetical protein